MQGSLMEANVAGRPFPTTMADQDVSAGNVAGPFPVGTPDQAVRASQRAFSFIKMEW